MDCDAGVALLGLGMRRKPINSILERTCREACSQEVLILPTVSSAASAALGFLSPSILLQLEIQAQRSKPQAGLWLLQEVSRDSYMTHLASFGFLTAN